MGVVDSVWKKKGSIGVWIVSLVGFVYFLVELENFKLSFLLS